MRSYIEEINDVIENLGGTPKSQYEELTKVIRENSLYKGRVDFLLRNIKAVADTDTLDATFRELLQIVYEVGSKPIGIYESTELTRIENGSTD